MAVSCFSENAVDRTESIPASFVIQHNNRRMFTRHQRYDCLSLRSAASRITLSSPASRPSPRYNESVRTPATIQQHLGFHHRVCWICNAGQRNVVPQFVLYCCWVKVRSGRCSSSICVGVFDPFCLMLQGHDSKGQRLCCTRKAAPLRLEGG